MSGTPYAEAFTESLQPLAAEVGMSERDVETLAAQLADRAITDQDSEQQIMVLRGADG